MKLNLGAGKNWRKEGWTNVDKIYGFAEAEVQDGQVSLDFEGKVWPFEPNSVDAIFCSHVLEHLTDKAFRRLLKNCYKSMKPDSAIRIIVPDFGKAMQKYKEKDVAWFYDNRVKSEISLQGNSMPRRMLCFAIRYSHENYIGGPQVSNAEIEEAMRLGPDGFLRWAKNLIPQGATTDHCNAFWQERLVKELTDAGFITFHGDPHAIQEFADKEFWNRPNISLIVDAVKQ